MEKERFVYRKSYKDYGNVRLTVGEVMKDRKMNTYRLSILTDVRWNIIKKYARGTLYRVDLDILSRICYALNCSLEELICYEPGAKEEGVRCKKKKKQKN